MDWGLMKIHKVMLKKLHFWETNFAKLILLILFFFLLFFLFLSCYRGQTKHFFKASGCLYQA